MPSLSAPYDIWIELSSNLSRVDILHLALTSSSIFNALSPVLYSSVCLNSVQQCATTLAMLQRCPDLASHVRELRIHIDTAEKSATNLLYENTQASALVRDIAASKRLNVLTTFIWHHAELPFQDGMWFALRMGCPQLRYISTTIGSCLPSHTTHLFDFHNLSGFSVRLLPSFYENNAEMFMNAEEQPIAKRFWDMIIIQCPDLECLAIEGISSLPTDAHQIVRGRWPKLRTLSLGDVVVDWDPRTLPPQKRPFITFLEEHPSLQSLSLSKRTIDIEHLSLLKLGIPNLVSFAGSLQHLQVMHNLQFTLKSLTLHPIRTREFSPLVVGNVLSKLSRLTDLTISFVLHSVYDSDHILRSLVSACPRLEFLDLACSHKPLPTLDTFSKSLQGFGRLQVLNLTIMKYPGDEGLSAGATRIATFNPRLKSFSLTFLPTSYPTPFSIPLFPLPLHSRDTGTFRLTRDNHGLPLTLCAYEKRRLLFPMGIGQYTWIRRYESDLRPLAARRGKNDILVLLTENTPAGEEIRMFLLCGLLVCSVCLVLLQEASERS